MNTIAKNKIPKHPVCYLLCTMANWCICAVKNMIVCKTGEKCVGWVQNVNHCLLGNSWISSKVQRIFDKVFKIFGFIYVGKCSKDMKKGAPVLMKFHMILEFIKLTLISVKCIHSWHKYLKNIINKILIFKCLIL